MNGLLAQDLKRSEQVKAPVDIRAQWQESKGEFKKVMSTLKPSGPYKCCQEDLFYTDEQKIFFNAFLTVHLSNM